MSRTLLSDARWRGPHGIGRFATEVLRRLPSHNQITCGPKPLSARDPLWTIWQAVSKRPAVYFSPGFNPPPLCRAPMVFTIHDLIQIRTTEVVTPSKRLYYSVILRPSCRRAFRVLTVSDYSRSLILDWTRLPAERVVNVGNGVDALFRPDGDRYQPGYRYVFYAGNHREHKNLGRLLRAFHDIRDHEVRLLLTGIPTSAMLQRVTQLGIARRTRFLGTVSDLDLSRYYRGAALVALPSLAEGFGLPALEAMACGVPVVASTAGALPEVVGGAGILIDPLNIGDLHRAMECVLGDPALEASMRRAGIERARLFSWDKVAGRVHAVLRQAGWDA